MIEWEQPSTCENGDLCWTVPGSLDPPQCVVCGLYVRGPKRYRYRIPTRMTEDKAFLDRRWEIVGWIKENCPGAILETLEWDNDKRTIMVIYYVSDATLGTMFKLHWL